MLHTNGPKYYITNNHYIHLNDMGKWSNTVTTSFALSVDDTDVGLGVGGTTGGDLDTELNDVFSNSIADTAGHLTQL